MSIEDILNKKKELRDARSKIRQLERAQDSLIQALLDKTEGYWEDIVTGLAQGGVDVTEEQMLNCLYDYLYNEPGLPDDTEFYDYAVAVFTGNTATNETPE